MSTEDIFKTSERRRAAMAEEQQQRNAIEAAEREDKLERARKNLPLIDQRLRAALKYLGQHEFATPRSNGYQIEHSFSLTTNPAVAAGQTYNVLTLFMGRQVTQTFSEPRYRAPYQLILKGDELSGTTSAHFHSTNDPHYDRQLDSLNLEGQLEPWIVQVFHDFVASVVSRDDSIRSVGS
ncbi:MAG: hypothetical protein WAO00_17895 [Chthoniobacterales bacterium]